MYCKTLLVKIYTFTKIYCVHSYTELMQILVLGQKIKRNKIRACIYNFINILHNYDYSVILLL